MIKPSKSYKLVERATGVVIAEGCARIMQRLRKQKEKEGIRAFILFSPGPHLTVGSVYKEQGAA